MQLLFSQKIAKNISGNVGVTFLMIKVSFLTFLTHDEKVKFIIMEKKFGSPKLNDLGALLQS